MKFLHKLVVDKIVQDGRYSDVYLHDLSPKANLRMWRFTYDAAEQSYYGMLMRAVDDEAAFDRYVVLPRSMADQLWQKCLPLIAERRLVHGY